MRVKQRLGPDVLSDDRQTHTRQNLLQCQRRTIPPQRLDFLHAVAAIHLWRLEFAHHLVFRQPARAERDQPLMQLHAMRHRRARVQVIVRQPRHHLHQTFALLQIVDHRRRRHPQHAQLRLLGGGQADERRHQLLALGKIFHRPLLGEMNFIHHHKINRLPLRELPHLVLRIFLLKRLVIQDNVTLRRRRLAHARRVFRSGRPIRRERFRRHQTVGIRFQNRRLPSLHHAVRTANHRELCADHAAGQHRRQRLARARARPVAFPPLLLNPRRHQPLHEIRQRRSALDRERIARRNRQRFHALILGQKFRAHPLRVGVALEIPRLCHGGSLVPKRVLPDFRERRGHEEINRLLIGGDDHRRL